MRVGLERWERVLVVGCLAVVVLLALGIIGHGPVADLDDRLNRALVIHGHRRWVFRISNVGDALRDVIAVTVLAFGAVVRSRSLRPVVYAAVTFVADFVVVNVVKVITHREGPGGHRRHELGGWAGYYPSGHAAAATALGMSVILLAFVVRGSALRIGRALRIATAAVGAAFGLVIGIATVLANFHWPSDIVAGTATTLAIMTVTTAWLARSLDVSQVDTRTP